MRHIFLIGIAFALSSCGVVYTSPNVRGAATSNENINVRVIPMSEQAAYEANLVPYAAQRLPASYKQVAGAALPTQEKSSSSQSVVTRIPPAKSVPDYEIGVSDVLLLATPNAGNTVEQLSGLLAAQNRRQGYIVQGDGTIAIPDVGRIPVSGLTLSDAETAVFNALVDRNIEPSFSLEVAEYNSQRVTISGAVRNATSAPITPKPLLLSDAIQLAGGVAPGSLDEAFVNIYRDGRVYQMPAREVFNGRAGRVRLLNNDSIVVDSSALTQESDRSQRFSEEATKYNIRRSQLQDQKSNFEKRLELGAVKRQSVYVFGEVVKQNKVDLPFEQKSTLADVLFSGGGISTRVADISQIYVLRRSNDPREIGARTAYHLNGRNALQMLTATVFEMRPNDMVFVSEQPITAWSRALNQALPTLNLLGSQAAVN